MSLFFLVSLRHAQHTHRRRSTQTRILLSTPMAIYSYTQAKVNDAASAQPHSTHTLTHTHSHHSHTLSCTALAHTQSEHPPHTEASSSLLSISQYQNHTHIHQYYIYNYSLRIILCDTQRDMHTVLCALALLLPLSVQESELCAVAAEVDSLSTGYV